MYENVCVFMCVCVERSFRMGKIKLLHCDGPQVAVKPEQ